MVADIQLNFDVQALYTDDNFVTSANGEETRKIFLRRGVRQGCSMR